MSVPQRVKLAEQLIHRLDWESLDRGAVRRLVELARDESAGALQPSPHEAGSRQRTAVFAAAEELVFCGASLLPLLGSAFGLKGGVHVRTADSARVAAGSVLATIAGPAAETRAVCTVAHAFLSRLSGVATHASRHARVLGGGRTRLLDSGATTPGWSALERHALACGGAWSGGGPGGRIRIDAEAGNLADLEPSVRRARESASGLPVELAVRSLAHVDAAVAAAPDLIRLERFEPRAIHEAVARTGGRVFVEAHGGIDLGNLAAHAGLGLDFVSVDGLVTGATPARIETAWRD